MKGRQTNLSNLFAIRFGASEIQLKRWKSVDSSLLLIYLLTATALLPNLIGCQTNSNVTVALENVTGSAQSTNLSIFKSPETTFRLSSSSEEDYYYYSDYSDGR